MYSVLKLAPVAQLAERGTYNTQIRSVMFVEVRFLLM